MGDEINIFIDNLISFTWRLLDLPLYFLLLLCLPAIILSRAILFVFQKRARFKYSKNKIFRIISICFLLISIALIIDHKFMVHKREMNTMHEKFISLYHNLNKHNNDRTINNVDLERKNNIPINGEIILPVENNPKKEDPKAKIFIAVIDLEFDGLGLTCEDAALMLKLLGADHAMACDQGGSSCMYVKNIDGIINRPADSDGRERAIYTHFGVKLN